MALNTEDNHAVNCRCKRGGGGGIESQLNIKYVRASCKSTWCTSEGKSVNIAEKKALMLVNLPSLKVIRALHSCNNLQTFVWWGA